MPQSVFISHSSKDKPVADQICGALESGGISCWIAPRNIPAATEWSEAIIQGIKESRLMLLLFSTSSNDSVQVRREVQRAFEHGIALMPIRLDTVVPCAALEYYIGALQWLDVFGEDIPDRIQKLVNRVGEILAGTPNSQTSLSAGDASLPAGVIALESPQQRAARLMPPSVAQSPTPPPSGMVTFLFTDIEGSTRLWDTYPDAMKQALSRHDVLLRQIIEMHGGYIFKTLGDAFCAAFPTTKPAITAAVEIQRALPRENWGEMSALKVRIGIHTGVAEERRGDYFGLTLSRVSRLMSAGHGGQILVSETVQGVVADGTDGPLLINGQAITLVDKGVHLLKDMSQPERVWQVAHPDLATEFPSLRSRPPAELPIIATSFVGREKEVAEIKQLLQTERAITVLGMGGAGKSRITQKVAHDLVNDYDDGVWLVELAPVSDPNLVPQTVASKLQVREVPGNNVVQTLINDLRGKKLLLLLDNLEHLLGACASLVDSIIRNCPNVTVLATSREAMGIPGEVLMPLPPLSLPDLENLPPLPRILEYEAVRLFVERATTAKPSFVLTDANVASVVQICTRLDGMPLAIQLAAARVTALPVEQIARRLDDRFRILTGGSRTALPHQQTLRALVDWSYEPLEEREKMLFRRLGVFVGGWKLEFAETICADESLEDWEVLDLMTVLVNKSLVVYEEQDGEARYRYLETIQQYSRDRLRESGEEETLRQRHAEYFLEFARNLLPQVRTPNEAAALSDLEGQVSNLRGAMQAARESSNWPLFAELSLAVGVYLQQRGYQSEAVLPIQEGLDSLLVGDPVSNSLYARLLRERGALHLDLEQTVEARQQIQEAVRLFEELDDQRSAAQSRNLLGQTAIREKAYDEARGYLEQALNEFERLKDRVEVANVHNNLGIAERLAGHLDEARNHNKESLRLRRAIGDKRGIAEAQNNLGVLAKERYDLTHNITELKEAWTCYWETLQIGQEMQNKRNIGISLFNLGEITEQPDNSTARLTACRFYAAAESLFHTIKSPYERFAADALQRVADTLTQSGIPTDPATVQQEVREQGVDQIISAAASFSLK